MRRRAGVIHRMQPLRVERDSQCRTVSLPSKNKIRQAVDEDDVGIEESGVSAVSPERVLAFEYFHGRSFPDDE